MLNNLCLCLKRVLKILVKSINISMGRMIKITKSLIFTCFQTPIKMIVVFRVQICQRRKYLWPIALIWLILLPASTADKRSHQLSKQSVACPETKTHLKTWHREDKISCISLRTKILKNCFKGLLRKWEVNKLNENPICKRSNLTIS